MSKYYLIFGGIAGITSATLEYLLYNGTFGYDKIGGVLFGKILALLGCIVFAVILIKKLHGGISFLRTSFSGLMIAIVCSAFSGIGYSMMYHAKDGTFFDDVKDYRLELWKEQNKDNPEELAQIEDMKIQIEQAFSLKYHTYLELAGFLAIGTVFTAFFAGIIADRKSLAG